MEVSPNNGIQKGLWMGYILVTRFWGGVIETDSETPNPRYVQAPNVDRNLLPLTDIAGSPPILSECLFRILTAVISTDVSLIL